MATMRKKTTVYLDPTLLRAVKVLAAGAGRHDYEIFEDALRQYLNTAHGETSRQVLIDLLDQLGEDESPPNDEIQDLAYTELHAVRKERRRG